MTKQQDVIICPYGLTIALAQWSDLLSGHAVTAISRQNGRFRVQTANGRAFRAPVVVNAAGTNCNIIATRWVDAA